jgi:hypothetical protein
MTSTIAIGRLGNQIIRNLAVSIIAEKYNLYVDYSSYNLIKNLGIDLFIGKNKNKHNNTIKLLDDNYFDIYENKNENENNSLDVNLNPNENFFQTKDITNLIYNYLHSDKIKQNIINKNPFTQRYNTNNDIFIHIRLTDVAKFNPGLKYYLQAISSINYDSSNDNIYISTDDKNHNIIKQIIEKYPKTIIINYDEIKTFQFGSTCKNIILSHGSFSAIIGYLGFFSNVYYPEYETNKIWYGDIFSINVWHKLVV